MKIFLDSSDINEIRKWKDKVQGFTTNPTLMRKAGVTDYEAFCKEVLVEVGDKPVSFEVFADDFEEMERQAKIISSWGDNVYVKIPVTNTRGEPSNELIRKLNRKGIKINITAVCNYFPIQFITLLVGYPKELLTDKSIIISVFCGRIADTGRDPEWILREVKSHVNQDSRLRNKNISYLWASPREVFNIYQAEEAEADIITCTPELLTKYEKFKGMNLKQLSLDTVKMFHQDAKEAGYKI